MRTGNALDSRVFRLAHVNVSDVTAEVGLGGEDPDTQVASLVAGVVRLGADQGWEGGGG